MPHPHGAPSPLSRRSFLTTSALAAGALSVPWLSGCGSDSDSGAGADNASTTGEWKAMTWEGKDEMKKWNLHLTNYFKKYPDLKWTVDFGLEWEQYWTKLQTSVAGGVPPDMCWMHDTRVGLFASQGLLEPIDDYLAAQVPDGWPADFYSTQVEAFKFDGKQYGFPYDWASGGLFINLDWLEEAGVKVPDENWTYEDLLIAAQKLTESADGQGKQWGMSLPTSSGGSYPMVRSYGGDFVPAGTTEMHYADPGTVAAYQYLYDAINTHKVMPSTTQITAATGGSGDTAALFSSGRVAILHNLNDAAFVMEDLIKGKFRWTVAPVPKGPSGRFQFVGGSAFAIPKDSKHPDVTYEFMKYALSDPKNLPVTAEMGSMFVSNTKFWEDGVPDKAVLDPAAFRHTFYDLGKTAGVSPNYFPNYGRWDSSVYSKNMDNLWANKDTDVAKVLNQVQSETQPLLQS